MKKIVLIEDNADVRETTKEILELANYYVVATDNGKSGVELTKTVKPDLVICDIMMPDLDGYGVLHILGKNPTTSQIPFIFLTAKSEKGDMRKGMNLGADDYITKPFEETELLNAVETRINRSEIFKRDFDQNLEGINHFINEAQGLRELNDLSKDRKIKAFTRKEIIYHEGDYANYLYFIIEGQAKCLKTDDYGKHFVNEICSKGDFMGYLTLMEGLDYHETAIAMTPTKVAVIPKHDFLALIQRNRSVATRFIKMLSGNLQDRETRMLQLAYASVRERLAKTLLKLSSRERPESDATVKFTIPRQDLAGLVGTAKESLNRTMSELKAEGLVNTDGQEIEILNEDGLHKAANGF